MIEVEGYKAFHGSLLVAPVNGNSPFVISDTDFLYKPDTKCWYGKGRSFPELISTVVLDKTKSEHKCGQGCEIKFGKDTLDQCVYEIVETHENVTVEVLKCEKCGNVEISWYDPEEVGELE